VRAEFFVALPAPADLMVSLQENSEAAAKRLKHRPAAQTMVLARTA